MKTKAAVVDELGAKRSCATSMTIQHVNLVSEERTINAAFDHLAEGHTVRQVITF